MRQLLARPAVAVTVIAVLVMVWISSGRFTGDRGLDDDVRADRFMTVAVEHSRQQAIEQLLTLQGEITPFQTVTVRAETAGQIASLHVDRGTDVSQGQLLLRIDPGEREARLRQQEAELARARRDHEAVQSLSAGGLAAQLQLDTAAATLRAAEAALESIQRDLQRTTVYAPVDGILERQLVERGEWVPVGEELFDIVVNDPLKAVVDIPQHRIGVVQRGNPARVRPVGSTQEIEGRISYIARVANPVTRTFRVEVDISNPDRALPAGTSAQVIIPTAVTQAHRVSPALLGLDDEGNVGLKVVDDDNLVHFYPVTVVRSDSLGLWVTGLPPETQIITAGAAFVRAGEEVRTQVSNSSPAP